MDTHCKMAIRNGSGERQNLGAVSSFLGKRNKREKKREKKGGGGASTTKRT